MPDSAPPIPQIHTLVNTGKPIRYVLADDYAKLEQELSAAKAAHGETLLLLNKAAFETIPKLEQEAAALRAENERLDRYGKQEYRIECLLRKDLETMFEEKKALEAQLARYRAPMSDSEVNGLFVILTALHEEVKPPTREDVRMAMDALIEARKEEK